VIIASISFSAPTPPFFGPVCVVQVELRDWDRPTEQIALHKVYSCVPHVFELFFGLDPLSRRDGAKTLRQCKNRRHYRCAIAAIENALCERFVESASLIFLFEIATVMARCFAGQPVKSGAERARITEAALDCNRRDGQLAFRQ
jgi:hypothetical protein